MSLVEKTIHGDVVVIRMNRPEKRNAMSGPFMRELGAAFTEFRDDPTQKIAILTGTGPAFCAGEDLVESAERGTPGLDPTLPNDPFWNDAKGPGDRIMKPIISAVNGWAMGGGFIMAWMSDFRVATRDAVFEISEARHWLIGAYHFGYTDTLPWSIATELAMGFRMSGERAHQVGFVNRLADTQEDLLPQAFELCDHLLSIPAASLDNTLRVARRLRPQIPAEVDAYGKSLVQGGDDEVMAEARRAFAEKREPVRTS